MTITTDEPGPPGQLPRSAPWLQTPAAKAMMIIALTLALLVPLRLVDQVNQDRVAHQEEARLEYQKSWGPSQSVIGPILVVPYMTQADEHPRYLNIAPHRLTVTSRLQPELRRRGLFRAIVYQASVALTGEFNLARDALPIPADAQVSWGNARIILGASDLRALQPDPAVSWNGRKLPLGDAVANQGDCSGYALLSAAPFSQDASAPAGAISFAAEVDLRGTGPLHINPVGHQVELKASAPWPAPSFSGFALPTHYRSDTDGFTADWTITSNPTTGPWIWSSSTTPSCAGGITNGPRVSRQISVELLDAMPIYHMTERASKYAILFLSLTFLTYFLFETIAQVNIHVVQYGLLGLSVTLFGLLLISFSEPLGFTPAYAVSTALVLGQASLFTWSVTRTRQLAAIFAAILAALFGFLYLVISMELYSLLVGSLALFTALSVVMIVTRRVSWSAIRQPPRASREAGRGILS